MFRLILISTLFVTAYGSGQLSILKSPKSVSFKGADRLEEQSLGDVLAATLGYSVEYSSEWNGLLINDPFNLAQGAVAVVIDGLETLPSSVNNKAKTFELYGTGGQNSLDTLTYRVRLPVDLDLMQGLDSLELYNIKLANEKTTSSLKPQFYAEDKLFLEQIAAINALSEKLASITDLPTLVTIRLSFAPLLSAHLTDSPAAITEAQKLLSAAIEQLTAAAEKAYNGNVVVAAITIKDESMRSKRSTGARSDTFDHETLNLAKNYNENYPVIFNILFWFGVIMLFSLLAISYTIGYMDPGRDSIIYRMTSTRMKKDN